MRNIGKYLDEQHNNSKQNFSSLSQEVNTYRTKLELAIYLRHINQYWLAKQTNKNPNEHKPNRSIKWMRKEIKRRTNHLQTNQDAITNNQKNVKCSSFGRDINPVPIVSSGNGFARGRKFGVANTAFYHPPQ